MDEIPSDDNKHNQQVHTDVSDDMALIISDNITLRILSNNNSNGND